MNFILEGILGVLGKLAEFVIAGGVTILNLSFSAIESSLNAALALLPSLPEPVAPPEFVEAINWFFPVGAVVSIATGLLVSYGVFLSVRWILVKSGAIS